MSEALDRELRKGLAKAVRLARGTADAGARTALGALGVGAAEADPSLSVEDRALRRRLRAHGRALGDLRRGDGQEIGRLAHEVAYDQWHRMLFARFLAENDLLIEPESGVPVSLAECRELARERGEDPWRMVAGFAERMLPRIFRPDDPSLAMELPPEVRQALEKTLGDLPAPVFRADDALGWTYQFWQTDRKEEVNKKGEKIGADELPAVTQLFTERYMVRFLFHNTVGAWRAAKLLATRPELRENAGGETDLRQAVRLKSAGGYEFDYLRFVREPAPETDDGSDPGRWRPAAGSFSEWPRRAADIKVLDPCCGSGHFLVEGLHLFVRLRMEEENLGLQEAIRAVLQDNLHGLEIDPRCAQIAAFSVALAAWKLAGRVIKLPPLQIACSGVAPNATREEWLALAGRNPLAGAAPPADLYGRRVFAARESLLSGSQRHTLGALHDVFREAPTLGSLIDPRAAGAGVFAAGFTSVQPLLERALAEEDADPERRERAVAAAGMSRAAALLAESYTLVITNVPYLARGRQDATLRDFADRKHRNAKGDLATMFVDRAFGWLGDYGAQAVVVPQNWLFQKTYRRLREELLARRRWRFMARLGEHAFEDHAAAGAFAALTVTTADLPRADCQMTGLDVSAPRGAAPILAAQKAVLARSAPLVLCPQRDQLRNPDSAIALETSQPGARLGDYAHTHQGASTTDKNRFVVRLWEVPQLSRTWVPYQMAADQSAEVSGCHSLLRWENGSGRLTELDRACIRGQPAWGRDGVAVAVTGGLPRCLYLGSAFDDTTAVIVPERQQHLAAIRAFVFSQGFPAAVRQVDQGLSVTESSFEKTAFDLTHWDSAAAEQSVNGLPKPYSDDATQWIFHGHPCGSVVWDTEAKRTADSPLRSDATVLQVAVARLLGYRWPAERDPEMRLADEARALVRRCAPLAPFADDDGIVCLPAVRGEAPAADRLRSLIAAAYGDAWSGEIEQRLLGAAGAGSTPAGTLDDWLRKHFFAEHCRLFHHRPFVWHIWDGLPDGFSALVSYHRLAGPDGGGRRTLESLTYSYLGDWIERQRTAQREDTPGADARLAAAEELKTQLEAILAGEPPLDIFIRWKPLPEQPIGWHPDLNDGVRLNIRPFLRAELRKGGRKGAGILRLRVRPNIKWGKDRGKEPQHLRPKHKGDKPREYRPRTDFPWFWSCPGDGSERDRTDFPGGSAFDGARWNDLHYTTAAKRAARERQFDHA